MEERGGEGEMDSRFDADAALIFEMQTLRRNNFEKLISSDFRFNYRML